MYISTHHLGTTFGSSDVEKWHAAVARSTFSSQNVKNMRGSNHSWMDRCRKVHAIVARIALPSQSQNVKNMRVWRDI